MRGRVAYKVGPSLAREIIIYGVFPVSKPNVTGAVVNACLDSGSTGICFRQRAAFSDYETVSGRFCEVASGARVPIRGVGSVPVVFQDDKGRSRSATLPNCLHIPDFSMDLIGIRPLWKSLGVKVRFEDDNFLLLPDTSTVPFDPTSHCLRRLRLQLANASHSAMRNVHGKRTTQYSAPWHARLGIPDSGFTRVQRLCADVTPASDTSHGCPGCLEGSAKHI